MFSLSHTILKNSKNSLPCSKSPLLAGIGSIAMQAISPLKSITACSTASLLYNGSTMVSLAKAAGIPAESALPKVTKPDPAFTNSESTWPW